MNIRILGFVGRNLGQISVTDGSDMVRFGVKQENTNTMVYNKWLSIENNS